MWTSSRRWSMSKTVTSKAWTAWSPRKVASHEGSQGTLVWLRADGPDPGGRAGHGDQRPDHDQRPLWPAHALAGGRRHHARLSHRVHAHGHGHAVRVFRLSLGRPDLGGSDPADAGPDGAARVFGDEQRRADLDPAVCLLGLPGRAR